MPDFCAVALVGVLSILVYTFLILFLDVEFVLLRRTADLTTEVFAIGRRICGSPGNARARASFKLTVSLDSVDGRRCGIAKYHWRIQG
jgi:hypothetical protein